MTGKTLVAVVAASLALFSTCSSGSGTGGSGGGSHTGGSGTGGSNGGGSATGGSSTGGSGTGGSATGGGSGGQTCDMLKNPTCPSGQVCLFDSQLGTSASCFTGCDQARQNCGGGLKCTYVQTGPGTLGRACVDAGTVAENQTCVQDAVGDNCQAGLFCLPSTMTCSRFCNLVDAPCPDTESCAGLVNVMTEFALICEPSCDLYEQNCMNSETCLPAQGGGTVCNASGTVMQGGTCSLTMACAKGLACVNTGSGVVKCLSFCNLDGGMPTCTMGTCTKPLNALKENAGFCL